MTDPLTKELADYLDKVALWHPESGDWDIVRDIASQLRSMPDAAQSTPEPAQRTDPTPEQMLKGANDLEAIAQGIRDAVAGRVTPLEEVMADTRELEKEKQG